MKGVIFLLALYAFQMVLADFKSNLCYLNGRSINEMNSIVWKLHEDIRAILNNKWRSGLSESPSECWEDYRALDALFTHTVNMLDFDCYYPAAHSGKIEDARVCYAEKIAFIKEKEREHRANTIACFQRHGDEQVALIALGFA